MRPATAAILFVLIVSVVMGWSQSSGIQQPVIGYTRDGVLTIVSASGKVLRTFKTVPKIGTFDFSPDGRSVVFAPSGPKGNGGQLYLLSIDTGRVARITHGFSYDSREVYSDPEFSPDGGQILFAIHASSNGDAVMAAGPYASLSLRSGVVRLLPSTKDIQGHGAAFGGSSRWSPDGKQIFLNLESGFELTEPAGKALLDTSSWISDADVTFAVDWIGNGCVLFIGGKDWTDAESKPARVLNIRNHQDQPLTTIFGRNRQQLINPVAVSPSIIVLKKDRDFIVQTTRDEWSIPSAPLHAALRILPEAARIPTPEGCN